MSASTAQILANRQNSQLSTGPVTASGKFNSSRNSAGPIAKLLALTGEDEQKLACTIDTYLQRLMPVDQIESDMIVDMAVARWRRSRLLEFEASLLSNSMETVRAELGPEAPRVQVQAIAMERLIDGSKTWATLNRYMKDAERTINLCIKHLLIDPPIDVARRPQPAPQPQPQVPPRQRPQPVQKAPEPPRKNEANSNPNRFGPNVPLRPNGYPVNLSLAL